LSERATSDDDFEDLFENAPCGYLSLDQRGRILRLNRTLAGWLGHDQSDVPGKSLGDFLPIAGRMYFETHLKPTLRMNGFFNEVALELLTATGDRLPVIANALERKDESGDLQFTRITLFLAIERRRYEKNLLQGEHVATSALGEERASSALREQFIAVLGHDLRNPLAGLIGGVTILQREDSSPRAASVTSMMLDTVARMSGLIDNILDFARGRLGSGIPLAWEDAIPVAPLLEQVVAEMRAAQSDRDFRLDAPTSIRLRCDPSRIGQLVSNLLGNAVTHGSATEPIRVLARETSEGVEIAVANGGEPIPEAAMERLFQPFFRGEVRPSLQGLGLGLHISAEIAKAHGGDLIVASDDRETRFTFRMPSAPSLT
jgi:sigma-B regulation protein RsbU (phosphoserine phosphatase)